MPRWVRGLWRPRRSSWSAQYWPFAPRAYETYILLANPGDADAQVTLTYLRASGAPLTKTFTVPKASRLNIPTGAGGLTWSAGTNATGTRMLPVP